MLLLRTTARWSLRSPHSVCIACPRYGSMRRTIATLPRTPLFEALHRHDRNSLAVIHSASKESFTYGSLLNDVIAAKERFAAQIEGDTKTLRGECIAFLIENGYDYVVHLLAILASDAIALPLAPSFPPGELRYNLNHSQAKLLVVSSQHEKQARQVLEADLALAPRLVRSQLIGAGDDRQTIDQDHRPEPQNTDQGGMMLYTSGTTSRPVSISEVKSACCPPTDSHHRKASYYPHLSSKLRSKRCAKHGSIRRKTICSTSSHYTTFTAPSTRYSRHSTQEARSSFCFPSTQTPSSSASPDLFYLGPASTMRP